MPLLFDEDYLLFRLLSPIPNSLFGLYLYLRTRRLLPLAIAHGLLDSATVVIGSLLPLLRR
jgi:hypothetical protein